MALPLWFAPDTDNTDHTSYPTHDDGDVVPTHFAEDPDAELLARLRADDVDALSALFDRHTPALWRFTSAIVGSQDLARDIVQDVFFDLWSRRATLAVRTTLRAFLFASARGRALHALRAARTEQRVQDTVAANDEHRGLSTPPTRPDQQLEETELADAVASAMGQLTPRVRAVAELRWYGKMSYAEIAGVLGVSERTVNNQLTTAARTLRQLLAGIRSE